MRLMLGTKDNPSLLVDVEQEHGPNHFDFWVVNGAWHGTFYEGFITLHDCPSGDYSSLDKVEILCDNQDRLRSSYMHGGYQEVFNNFHDPNYVAYKPKVVHDFDDDIPF